MNLYLGGYRENKEKIRAIDCEIVEGRILSDISSYAKLLKTDWEERARENPTIYVMAESNAKEINIQRSGLVDVCNEYYPRVKDYLDIDNSIVLEIGCGIGRMSYYIAKMCNTLYAGDISRELLGIARSRIYESGNIKFIELDGFSLKEIQSNSIDIVFEYIVFQHIPSKDIIRNYIEEICRVLKPKGHAIFHGRDVDGIKTDDNFTGNTWHGARMSPELVRQSIENTECVIIKEEGISTDRYWVVLEKG